MVSASGKYREIRKALADAGAFDAAFEAREIIREYTGSTPELLDELDEEQIQAVDNALDRRLGGEPLQYIFGKWEFYGYPFYVGKGVLIPRPETELLVDIAVKQLSEGGRALDLFSGSGCVPVSIALKTSAQCYAVELYDEAFGYLERNIVLNSAEVTAVNGNAFDGSLLGDMTFDVITANPPYLTSSEMRGIMKELTFEPGTALFGGEDGLDAYRRFIPAWADRVKVGGIMAAETGETQGAAVSAIMSAAGFSVSVIKDHSGMDRVVVGKK